MSPSLRSGLRPVRFAHGMLALSLCCRSNHMSQFLGVRGSRELLGAMSEAGNDGGALTRFAPDVEPRLRRALVAWYGIEVGSEATADARSRLGTLGHDRADVEPRSLPLPGRTITQPALPAPSAGSTRGSRDRGCRYRSTAPSRAGQAFESAARRGAARARTRLDAVTSAGFRVRRRAAPLRAKDGEFSGAAHRFPQRRLDRRRVVGRLRHVNRATASIVVVRVPQALPWSSQRRPSASRSSKRVRSSSSRPAAAERCSSMRAT